MSAKKARVRLPIGRAAMIMFQMVILRDECCEAADKLMKQKVLDEAELDECARLDDALAEAHRVLKSAVSRVTISRLKRRSRTH